MVRKRVWRGPGSAVALLAMAMAMALPLGAQTPADGLQLTTIDPPRSETGDRYRKAAGVRAQTQATYATDVQGGRLTTDSRAPVPTLAPVSGPVIGGNAAMLLVVGGLALMLFLWLRFGGGGLLARTPAQGAAPAITPDGWATHAGAGPEGDVLARAAAMADRRAALVLLLRACLLQAAAATGTRLARSDTERRVLARLPAAFAPRPALTELLARTELAHYGGRDVSEADFAASLRAARHLLGGVHG